MARLSARARIAAIQPGSLAMTLPPKSFFLISAVFHYLGPAFAVLLFAQIDILGVAWLRIVSAAVIFGLWRRPWRRLAALAPADRRLIVSWAVVLR